MCRLWEGGLLVHSTLIDCYIGILFLWDLGHFVPVGSWGYLIMHQISVHSDSILLFEKQLKTHTNSSCSHIFLVFYIIQRQDNAQIVTMTFCMQ